MVKKVRFSLDLRDVLEKSNNAGNIVEPMDVISDELLDELIDDMITNHIKDFILTYIKKQLDSGSLESEGDLLF